MEDTICPTSSGISLPAGRRPLSVHPNPSSGRFTVFHGERADMPYTVVDLTGRTVASGILRGKRTTLDLSGKANGLYLFRVRNRVQRLLKE